MERGSKIILIRPAAGRGYLFNGLRLTCSQLGPLALNPHMEPVRHRRGERKGELLNLCHENLYQKEVLNPSQNFYSVRTWLIVLLFKSPRLVLSLIVEGFTISFQQFNF